MQQVIVIDNLDGKPRKCGLGQRGDNRRWGDCITAADDAQGGDLQDFYGRLILCKIKSRSKENQSGRCLRMVNGIAGSHQPAKTRADEEQVVLLGAEFS